MNPSADRAIWRRGAGSQKRKTPEAQEQIAVKTDVREMVNRYIQSAADPKILAAEEEEKKRAAATAAEKTEEGGKGKQPAAVKRYAWQGVGADARHAKSNPRDQHRTKAQKMMLNQQGGAANSKKSKKQLHGHAKGGLMHQKMQKMHEKEESDSSSYDEEDGKSAAFGRK